MKWLIDKAESMPQDLLTDCLENLVPRVWATVWPDQSALKRLARVYNDHLNPSSVPINMRCPECRGQLVSYWGYLKRYYDAKKV